MKNILIYIIVFGTCLTLKAQDTLITERDTIITNTGKIEVDQVEVIKAFEANLSDAKRISVKPTVPKVVPVDKSYRYEITIVPVDILYPDPVIKPLAMSADQAKNVNKFYSRIGYGDLKSPYADISYHGVRGDELDYYVSGHYYGADDSKNLDFRKFSEADLALGGGYRIGENNKVHIDLNGQYDTRYLYDTLFTNIDDDRKITATEFDITTRFGTIETTDAGIDYNAFLNIGLINFKALFPETESKFRAGFDAQKMFGNAFGVTLEAEAETNNLKESILELDSRRAFLIKPGVRFNKGIFSFNAKADIFIDNADTHPFIETELGIALMDNSLQVYAGVDQEIQNNTLANRFNENPFVNLTLADITKNTIAKQYYGGVRGKLREFLSFNFAGGYEDITDQMFYRSDFGIVNRMVFDDMTNIFINANLEFKVNDVFTIGGVVDQNFFSPATLERAINMPEYTYNAYAIASLLGNKLKIRSDIILRDKINYIDDFEVWHTGNNQLDINLGFDFFITKKIGIWAKANNLLDREYQILEHLPGIGRSFLGGVLVKF